MPGAGTGGAVVVPGTTGTFLSTPTDDNFLKIKTGTLFVGQLIKNPKSRHHGGNDSNACHDEHHLPCTWPWHHQGHPHQVFKSQLAINQAAILWLCIGSFQNVTNINCWHFFLSQLLKPPKKEKKKYYAPPSYGYGYQVSLAICWKLVLAQNIDYTNFRTTRMLTPMVDTTIMPGISYQDLNLLWRLKLLSQLKFVTVLYLLWCQQLESKSWQKSVEKNIESFNLQKWNW